MLVVPVLISLFNLLLLNAEEIIILLPIVLIKSSAK